MNEALYTQGVRDNIVSGSGTFSKVDSFAEVAMELGYSYPFSHSEVTLDSVSGDNNKDIWLQLNKYAKVLAKKLPNGIEAEAPNFVMHHNFKVNGTAGKAGVSYMPFTVTLNDGQMLTALVRNSEVAKSYQAKKPTVVMKWALNAQDITREVYKNGDDSIDMATTVARLAKIIGLVHTRFVLKNPVAPKIDLAKEIDNMKIDLGNVAWEAKDNREAKIKSAVKKGLKTSNLEEAQQILDDILETYDTESDPIDRGANWVEKLTEPLEKHIIMLETEPEDDSTEITAENIAEFYPSMSDDELEENRGLLGNIFKDRAIEVKNGLGLDITEYAKHHKSDTMSERTGVVKESFFGIKDNLEPIDEYIAKIKDSKAYKAYLAKQEPTPSDADTKTAEELNTKHELEKHDFEVEATVKDGYFELIDIGDKPKLVMGGTKKEIEEYILSHKKAEEEANKPTEEPKPTDAELIAKITEDKVYKQIMKDSHGGVMYDVDNKYDATHLLELWGQVHDKESQNGIVRGAIGFLKDGGNIQKEDKPNKSVDYDFSKFDKITTSEEFENELDTLAEQIEADGKMDDNEDKLNELADKLTEMMKAENE